MSKTPISYLQELMVAKNQALPKYTDLMSDKAGYSFKCVVNCVGGVQGIGYGSTKKAAKHDSAQDALRKLGIELTELTPLNVSQSFVSSSTSDVASVPPMENYIGALLEMAAQMAKPTPTFREQWDGMGVFKVVCVFLDMVTTGTGSSKKLAKHMAAKNMFNQVKAKGPFFENGNNLMMLPVEEKEDQFVKNVHMLNEKMKRLSVNSEDNGKSSSEISTTILKSVQEKLGDDNEIRVFQQCPYIVTLRLKESQITLLGVGITEQEAAEDLLQAMSRLNKIC